MALSSVSEAAMACGMPLPSQPGKKRRVSQMISAKPAGATIRLDHQARCTTSR